MMRARLRKLREALRNDHGSLSMAVVLWAPIVVILMAFIVDVGFLISDRERASDLAEQAARRVAEDVDEGWLHTGAQYLTGPYAGQPLGIAVNVDDPKNPQTLTCKFAAQQYIKDIVANGSIPADAVDLNSVQCSIDRNPDQQNPTVNPKITVTLQMKYTPVFTYFVNKGGTTVTGTGTASPVIPQ